jgi:choline dehydrogenase
MYEYVNVRTGSAGRVPARVDRPRRVRGIEGPHAVDASLMPCISSRNTNAAPVMIGEKGSEPILGNPSPARSNVHPLRAA